MSALNLTVVLTNRNHGHFLSQSLAALLGQTRPANEIIAIDDMSDDDSVAVMTRMLTGCAMARIVRNETHLGTVRSLNRGLAMARGDVVFFMAADDVTYPTLFATGMAALEAYPRSALFSARSHWIDATGRSGGILPTPVPLRGCGYLSPNVAASFLMHNGGWLMGNTTLYRRDTLTAAGGFPEELGSFTDGYISQLLALKYGACFSPDVLGAWRRVEGGYSWSLATNPNEAKRVADRAVALMSAAGSPFPAGYAVRWRGRFMFGAQRFALRQAHRKTEGGILRQTVGIAIELTKTLRLMLALRSGDIVTVARRRLYYYFVEH